MYLKWKAARFKTTGSGSFTNYGVFEQTTYSYSWNFEFGEVKRMSEFACTPTATNVFDYVSGTFQTTPLFDPPFSGAASSAFGFLIGATVYYFHGKYWVRFGFSVPLAGIASDWYPFAQYGTLSFLDRTFPLYNDGAQSDGTTYGNQLNSSYSCTLEVIEENTPA